MLQLADDLSFGEIPSPRVSYLRIPAHRVAVSTCPPSLSHHAAVSLILHVVSRNSLRRHRLRTQAALLWRVRLLARHGSHKIFPLRFLRPHCGQRCCSMSCRCLCLVRSLLSRKQFSHIVLSFTARFTQQRAQKPALMRSVRVCRTTTMQFLHIRPPFFAGRVPHRVHQPRLASACRRALRKELRLFRQAEHRVLRMATLFRPQSVQTPALRRLWLARLVLFCRITRHRAQAVRFVTRGLSRHTRHKPRATAFFTLTLSLAMQLRQRLLSGAAGISRHTEHRPASIVRARRSRANRALSARHGAHRTRPATGARLRQLTHLLEPSVCAVLFLTRATMGVGMTSVLCTALYYFISRGKRVTALVRSETQSQPRLARAPV